jgi:hypothetical protein
MADRGVRTTRGSSVGDHRALGRGTIVVRHEPGCRFTDHWSPTLQ